MAIVEGMGGSSAVHYLSSLAAKTLFYIRVRITGNFLQRVSI